MKWMNLILVKASILSVAIGHAESNEIEEIDTNQDSSMTLFSSQKEDAVPLLEEINETEVSLQQEVADAGQEISDPLFAQDSLSNKSPLEDELSPEKTIDSNQIDLAIAESPDPTVLETPLEEIVEKEIVKEDSLETPPDVTVQEEEIASAKPNHETLASASSLEPKFVKVKSAFAFDVNLKEVFSKAPFIYSLLLLMSLGSLFLWSYTILSLRNASLMPEALLKHLRQKLTSNQYEEALALCLQQDNFFCRMIASGISTRKHGLPIMLETMKSEGQRATVIFWQKLALLNDIAIIAPMLGLLGTVLGMFYAFYDVNRSMESISSFFDGLGVSVGTTVAGLIVAIFALILHSIAKYRLVRRLALIENEAQSFVALIENKTSIEN